MAMMRVCDCCDKPANVVNVLFNKTDSGNKAKTALTVPIDLCEGCLSKMMSQFGKFKNSFIKNKGKEVIPLLPLGSTDGQEKTSTDPTPKDAAVPDHF